MSRNNIKTGTVSIGTSFEELPVYASNVLTIYAIGSDLRICAGQTDVSNATDANSFLLTSGAALEMKPVPNTPVYVKADNAGATLSYWFA